MKLLAAACLTATALTAMADTSFSMYDGRSTDKSNGAIAHTNLFILKTSLTDKLDGDVFILNKTYDTTETVTTREELGLTYKEPVTGTVTAWSRFSLGEKQKSGAEATSYYTIEPGVLVKLPANFSVKVSYYHRDAWGTTTDSDKMNEMRYAVNYNVTPKDRITVGVFRGISGYQPANLVYGGYTRSF